MAVALSAVEGRYVSFDGDVVDTTLDAVLSKDLLRGRPVRHFPSYAGMGHYQGQRTPNTYPTGGVRQGTAPQVHETRDNLV